MLLRSCMKTLKFILALLVVVAFTNTAHAQIYKWKDKNGYTRYSDTPPPNNSKIETLKSKKPIIATEQTPLSTIDAKQPLPVGADNKEVPPTQNAEDVAGQNRRNQAEVDKNVKQEKEALAKLKAENCKSAKANLETYVQGGRVSRINEKGEREYLGDADLKKGADKSRSEVSKHCN